MLYVQPCLQTAATRGARYLVLGSALVLAAACTAGQASDTAQRPVSAGQVSEVSQDVSETEHGFDGDGIVAVRAAGAQQVDFFQITSQGADRLELLFSVRMPEPPVDGDYRISFSPDPAARRVLIADCNKGGVPDMRVYDTQTGALIVDMATGFTANMRELTQSDIGEVDLIQSWWSDANDFVVQFSATRADGSDAGNFLVRYDVNALQPGDRAIAASYTRFVPNSLPTAAPSGFGPRPHPADAGYRLVAVDGRVTLDGLPVEGGPERVDYVTGVVAARALAGA